jgi:hypothetical protein
MQPPIQLLELTFDVTAAAAAINASTSWDKINMRTANPASPHHGTKDIWVRYGSLNDPDVLALNKPFAFDWYPTTLRPALEPICERLMDFVGGTFLGTVLITKVLAGNSVKPHIDPGWAAKTHSKYLVAIAANKQQTFAFEEAELRVETGEVFWFDNQKSHWVNNESTEDRISLIICIETPRGVHLP